MEISNEYFAEVSNKVATLREEVRTLLARITALETAGREVVIELRKISNDEYCDNDGRGCGSETIADELARKLSALLDGEPE